MSEKRLVEYFLVASADSEAQGPSTGGGGGGEGVLTPPVSPLSPLSEHTARGEPAFHHSDSLCHLKKKFFVCMCVCGFVL